MIQILRADARKIPLADASVDCVVTSPPYWGLRNYGVEGQIGLEKLHDCLGWARGENCGRCHVCVIRTVFAEVYRVLKPSGTLWLNYGDCYATGAGKVRNEPGGGYNGRAFREKYWGKHAAIGLPPMTQPNRLPIPGLKPKDMCMVPARVALALQADGWWLRSDIIWHKTNPMPFSMKDRPTPAHEYLFLFAKSRRYFFDYEAWKEPAIRRETTDVPFGWGVGDEPRDSAALQRHGVHRKSVGPNSRIHQDRTPRNRREPNKNPSAAAIGNHDFRNRRTVWAIGPDHIDEAHFAPFPRALVRPCLLAGCPRGGVVLDPFGGSGTTAVEAKAQGKSAVILELNPDYIEIARRRIFADVTPSRVEAKSGQKLLLASS